MSKIKITCDSTCDLSPELYQENGIEMIPLGIVLGNKVYNDGIGISAAEVFAYADQTGMLPKTSAISPMAYKKVFSRYIDAGYQVIHINISSELSACYQNACIAAKETEHVYPVDSRNLSTGSGHLAIMASELVRAGKNACEIVQLLNETKARLDVSFVLHRLDYMKMGGRCSAVTAFGANMLQIRPEIEVSDGHMRLGKKYRGKLGRSVHDYIKGRLAGREDIDLRRIIITHAGVPDSVLNESIQYVKALQPFEEILVTSAGCTISSHCGPKCLGVLFFTR